MKNFLETADCALYHITLLENWENIQVAGLYCNDSGVIYLSKSAEKGILYSIAISQVLPLCDFAEFAVLKLPQRVNHFDVSEFSSDDQANEITRPFHCVLRRRHIPVENIELDEIVNMDALELGIIASNSDQKLPNSEVFIKALETEYQQSNGRIYRLHPEFDGERWIFHKF